MVAVSLKKKKNDYTKAYSTHNTEHTILNNSKLNELAEKVLKTDTEHSEEQVELIPQSYLNFLVKMTPCPYFIASNIR